MTVQSTLRSTIAARGLTGRELSRATGISDAVLSRFLRGHTHLSGRNIDILAAHLGLRLVGKPTTTKRKGA